MSATTSGVGLELGGSDPNFLTSRWKWSLRLIALVLVFLYSLVNRFAMNVDGISYLDMAYAYMKGDWKIAINSYWGAGYSWLLGGFLVPFGVPFYWESTVVHLVNSLVFIVALVAFEYLLKGVIQLRAQSHFGEIDTTPFDEWTWWVAGYVLFLLVNTLILPVTIVTPDMCVEAVVLLASGIVVRMAMGRDSTLVHVLLGVVLGIGYLIKSPMFPMGLLYVVMTWLIVSPARRRLYRPMVTLLIFLLISTPYIVLISRAAGRPTIGENARLTYADHAYGIYFLYWQGLESGSGTPRHKDATRKLMNAPDVYEFATATGGTLPPYYTPPYWADGLRLHLDWRGQLGILRDSAKEVVDLVYALREYFLIGLTFIFLQESAARFFRRMWEGWTIWLPAFVAFAMYTPIHIEPRFLGGYILLFWAGVCFALQFPQGQFAHRLFRAATLALALLVGYRILRPLREYVPPVQETVAQALAKHGLRSGDRVAQMLFENRDVHYWAHLGQFVIVAGIPFQQERVFWNSPPEIQCRVEQVLRQTGAKVLVTQNPPPLLVGARWERIAGTDYAVLFLNPEGCNIISK